MEINNFNLYKKSLKIINNINITFSKKLINSIIFENYEIKNKFLEEILNKFNNLGNFSIFKKNINKICKKEIFTFLKLIFHKRKIILEIFRIFMKNIKINKNFYKILKNLNFLNKLNIKIDNLNKCEKFLFIKIIVFLIHSEYIILNKNIYFNSETKYKIIKLKLFYKSLNHKILIFDNKFINKINKKNIYISNKLEFSKNIIKNNEKNIKIIYLYGKNPLIFFKFIRQDFFYLKSLKFLKMLKIYIKKLKYKIKILIIK